PDCREAFLSEAFDLFERIESLVLSLGRGTGHGHEATLYELGRCFHTLKGPAGSVGLIELASRVHFLQQGIEGAAGRITPELLDQLRQTLGHLETVLDSLRQNTGVDSNREVRAGAGPAPPTASGRPAAPSEPSRTTIHGPSLEEPRSTA